MWVMTEGEEGYMVSEVKGHISEPWGIILNQQKAIKLIEYLEWGEALEKGQVSVAPPKKLTTKTRRKA